MALKTDYKDDVLDTSVNMVRKFNLVDTEGNIVMENVSLQDITEYSQTGDSFGAGDINQITKQVNDLAAQVLTFTSKTVATSAWKSSSNEDFPYYADVTCSGVTTSYVPTVNFSLSDANSGIFSTVCESRSDAVRIYASEKPTATVTIPTIQCIKSV